MVMVSIDVVQHRHRVWFVICVTKNCWTWTCHQKTNVNFSFQPKLYNIIVAKLQPKPTNERQTNSNPTSEAAVVVSQKSLIPSVKPFVIDNAEDIDSFNFSQFLNGNSVSTRQRLHFHLQCSLSALFGRNSHALRNIQK